MPSRSLFHNTQDRNDQTPAPCGSDLLVLCALVSLMFSFYVLVSDFCCMTEMNDVEYGWALDVHVLKGPCISQCILLCNIC